MQFLMHEDAEYANSGIADMGILSQVDDSFILVAIDKNTS